MFGPDGEGFERINIACPREILKQALTDKVNDREVYMKGIDHSYYYEGYTIYKAEDL